MPMHDGGWGVMFGMWFFWLVVIALVILVVIWLVRAASGGGTGTRRDRSSEEILKERYARGDIDREEYQRRLEDLRR